MNILRFLIAAIFWVLGVLFLIDSFTEVFDWKLLIASITCFILAYVFCPPRPSSNHSDDFSDFLCFVTELPGRIITAPFRGIGNWMYDGHSSNDGGSGGSDSGSSD